MKRRLHIGVRPREDSYTAALQALERVETGDITVQEPRLYFETLADLSQMLTAERLELLVMILRYAPGSVEELARLTGREVICVHEDLGLLQQLGLVEFAMVEGQEGTQMPVLSYDEIALTIDLRALAGKKAA
jgi:predicted transcriptional regulator